MTKASFQVDVNRASAAMDSIRVEHGRKAYESAVVAVLAESTFAAQANKAESILRQLETQKEST